MKYCVKCGAAIDDAANFCAACGTPCSAVDDTAAEQVTLNNMYRMLKYERLCWKIFGYVWLGLTIFICVLFFFVLMGGISSGEEVLSVMGTTYLIVFGGMYTPIAIINLLMVKRTERYMNEIYYDIRPAAQRCGSVGMIVFSYFFNTIAMIFIIINFVRTKTDKQRIEQIAYKQHLARQNNIPQ